MIDTIAAFQFKTQQMEYHEMIWYGIQIKTVFRSVKSLPCKKFLELMRHKIKQSVPQVFIHFFNFRCYYIQRKKSSIAEPFKTAVTRKWHDKKYHP